MDGGPISTWTIILSMKEAFWGKLISGTLLGVVASYLGISADVLGAGFILIFIDLLTGIWVALEKRDKITSHKLRATTRKIALIGLATLTTYKLSVISPVLVYVHNAVVGYVAIHEVISIFENLGVLGFMPAKVIIDKLKSILKTSKLR